MNFLFRFAALLFVLAALAVSAAPPPGYYLVWGDEFNGTSLDPTKWWVWNQLDRSGYTVPAAVTEGGGYMTIHTYTANGVNYSAIISSDGFFRERYGYSEASVEFNGSPGMFSDFWLQSPENTGQIVGDPAATGAELDICEHRATDANDADNLSGNVTIDLHWNGYGSSEQSFNSPLYGSGLGTGFHTYGLLWSSTNYNASIDGVSTMNTNEGVSQRTEIILFSSEVDSNSFCGIVPPGGYGDFQDSSTSTVVDYFRFYAPTTTVYWRGASSPNWTDAGNWLSNMVPTAASDAVFSYLSAGNFNVTLNQSVAVNSLSFEETSPIAISGASLTINAGGIDMLSALYSAGIYAPVVLGAAQSWTVPLGLTLVANTIISGPGSLNVAGMGTVELLGTNNSTGLATVSAGTLLANGLMTGPVAVAGGTLTGTGTLTGSITVNSGTLAGTEILTGAVVVNAGGTLAPGSPSGTLTISNALTLQPGSSTVINVNASTAAAAQISGLSSITLGGTLIVSNLSGAFSAGNSFSIFNSAHYSGAFSRISPATPGAGLAWDSGALAAGTLRVISISNALLSANLAGNHLSLSWPSNTIGWLLQAQTNPPGVGITRNWVTIPGSSLINLTNFTVNPGIGSVFYRLISPSFSTSIFGAGDLIVLEVGNGSIAASGAPGVLKDFSPFGGTSPAQVALPSTGTNALIFGGSSYDGALSLSADGQSVVIAGYNAAVGSVSGAIDTSSTSGASAVRRAVGSIRADGTFTLNATTAQFSGSTIRSAAADGGGNFWAGGGSSGVVYLGTNSPAAIISTVSAATRNLGLAGGSLYFTETGSGAGLMAFSGLPKTAASPLLRISTAGTGSGAPSPKGFAVNNALTVAYVADNRTASTGGGIQRFNWNGSAWVYAYTIANTLTSSQEVWDLVVDFSGTNPILYAVTGEATGNHIVAATDTGSGSTFAKIAGAGSGDAFRGLAFAPAQP